MNLLKMFLFPGCVLIMMNCKNNSDAANNPGKGNETAVPVIAKQDSGGKMFDPMSIDAPERFYAPKGLRKLNIMEMFNLGSSNPNFRKTIILKDTLGNVVNWDYIDNPTKPMFMQMYADEDGKVIEGVVFPITDEIKAAIMKVRMVNQGQ